MRVLFSTDNHISNVQPPCRSDDYLLACIEELSETLDIAIEEKCDIFINGGDLFDIAEPNGVCRNLVIETLTNTKYCNLRKVCLIGNHDIKYNVQGIKNSALGTLFEAGILEHANELPEFGIANHDYRESIEQEIRDGLFKTREFPIHIVHGSIVLSDYRGNYILTKEIESNACTQLILAGHIHFPLRGKTKSGVKFLNPGSIGRNKFNSDHIGRMPQVVLLDYDLNDMSTLKVTLRQLSCSRKPEEIFKYEEVLLHKAEEKATAKFITEVTQSNEFWLTEKDRGTSLRKSGLQKGISEDIITVSIAAVDEINSLKNAGKQ